MKMKHYMAMLIGLLLAVSIGGAEETDDLRWTTYEDDYISLEYPQSMFELDTYNSPDLYALLDKQNHAYRLEIQLRLSGVSYHITLANPDEDITPYVRVLESIEIKI